MYYLGVVQHPANDTVCKGTNATLNCTIFDNSTDGIANSTSWVNNATERTIAGSMMVKNSRDGDIVTSVLIIMDVSDNSTYFCRPSHRTMSSVAVITVIGKKLTYTHSSIFRCAKHFILALFIKTY